MSPTWGGLKEPEGWGGRSEEQSTGRLALATACVRAALPLERSSVVELDYGFAARENRKRLWTNSRVSKEKTSIPFLGYLCCWGLFPLGS